MLTNFREGDEIVVGVAEAGAEVVRPSRGGLASGFLVGEKEEEDDDDDARGVDGRKGEEEKDPVQRYARCVRKKYSHSGVGGFSLLLGMMQDCGGSSGGSNGGSGSIEEKGSGGVAASVAASSGLAILSNRSPSSINTNNNNNNKDVHEPLGTADTSSHGHNTINTIQRLATLAGETHALSNTHYTDRSWSKVVNGEKLLADVIADSSRDFRNEDIKSNRGGSGSDSDNNDYSDSYNNIDTEKDTASSESNGIKTDCQPTEES